jgi:signal transduction histidine kinase/DNA-binding response OmpR family regulator
MPESSSRKVHYPKRSAELEEAGLLEVISEESFDRFTRLAARLLEVPVSLVSLVDREQQLINSYVGVPDTWFADEHEPLADTFFKQVLEHEEALVVEDVQAEPRVQGSEAILETGIRAYAAIPLTTSKGHTLGTLCAVDKNPRQWAEDELEVLRDLAAAIMVRVELREAKDEAQTANREKSQFLANVSHELRTPLNAVLGYTRLLKQDVGENDDMLDSLNEVQNAGQQLLDLINDVLDFSKIEAGEMELQSTTFEVTEMIDKVVGTVEPLLERNDNELEVECPSDIGTMHADLPKVRQALFNLLSNAAKFTANGTVTLTARRDEHDGRDDEIVFNVEDTGIGMSEEEQQEIFEEFTQGDASTTREEGGTGLGLAITYNVCRMMGGSVEVESEKDVGSTFTIRLPAYIEAPSHAPVEAEAPPDEEEEEKNEDYTFDVASEAHPTVLSIEDDASARNLIQRTLRRAGFAVRTASNGADGLHKARELKPDVITLDVMMPEMDGWAVLSELKDDDDLQDIPVVVVTVLGDEEMGYMLGASDFLMKPLNPDRLVEVIDHHRPDGPPCSVMVVDDEPSARKLIRDSMGEVPCDVTEAKDGWAALDMLDEANPDVIILDLMMPGMDGFEFLEELRAKEDRASTPVLMLTDKSLTEQEHEQLADSVTHIVEKNEHDQASILRQVRERIEAYHTQQ